MEERTAARIRKSRMPPKFKVEATTAFKTIQNNSEGCLKFIIIIIIVIIILNN